MTILMLVLYWNYLDVDYDYSHDSDEYEYNFFDKQIIFLSNKSLASWIKKITQSRLFKNCSRFIKVHPCNISMS